MNIKIKKYLFKIIITLILLGAVFFSLTLEKKNRKALTTSSAPLPPNTPPIITFTVQALGSFRGIIADILWMQAIKAQKENHFFEAMQLADWITTLEPEFERVWGFHSWNLVYNISALFPTSSDRWRWIQKGIALIRNKGIKYNPTSQKLYVDLAWLLQHKIGFYMDETHWFYKRKFAEEIELLLPYGKLSNLTDHNRKLLIENFCLLPETMKEIETLYGIKDWRVADTHAVYFAHIGKTIAEKKSEDPYISQDLLARALINSFKSGRLIIEEEQNIFCFTPKLELYPAITNIFEEILKKEENEFIRWRYNTFLANASVFLACYEKNTESKMLYTTLMKNDTNSLTYPTWEIFITNNLKLDPTSLGLYEVVAITEGTILKAIKAEQAHNYELATELYQKAKNLLYLYNNSLPTDSAKMRLSAPSFETLKYAATLRLEEN